ncbi:MAG: LPP20 family lipoprotein [Bacteroidetes bacterium]|nr:LPP20 family lipoprotein [Bacteroidota bacterium]MBL7110300.1 LPP20 family lipoprotein [Candidatus Neomarinimicrobiota bacterium]
MKQITLLSITLMMAFMVFGCAGSKVVHKQSDLPEWYLNPPEEEEYLYGIGEADGPDLGMTRTAAEAAARDDIVRQVAVKVNNMIKSSKQQIGQGADADVINMQQSASSQIASQMLRECKIIERKIDTGGGTYKAFALAKMSLAAMREETKKTLKKKDLQRQLEIGSELQDVLGKEIDKIDGSRE